MDTPLLARVRSGDDQALEAMWNSKQQQLVSYADRLFRGRRNVTPDGEGAVQSAMLSFWKGINDQRFVFDDDQGLMAILLTLVRRKVNRQLRASYRQKRGGGVPLLSIETSAPSGGAIQLAASTTADPAILAEAKEEVKRLFDLLDDANLRQIAILKMEGRTDIEISEAMGRSRATVARKLSLIRDTWKSEVMR